MLEIQGSKILLSTFMSFVILSSNSITYDFLYATNNINPFLYIFYLKFHI